MDQHYQSSTTSQIPQRVHLSSAQSYATEYAASSRYECRMTSPGRQRGYSFEGTVSRPDHIEEYTRANAMDRQLLMYQDTSESHGQDQAEKHGPHSKSPNDNWYAMEEKQICGDDDLVEQALPAIGLLEAQVHSMYQSRDPSPGMDFHSPVEANNASCRSGLVIVSPFSPYAQSSARPVNAWMAGSIKKESRPRA